MSFSELMLNKQSKSVKKYYEERYADYINDANNHLKREFINKKVAIRLIKYFKNKTVLELGGGAGYFSRYFKDSCFLISTDISFPFLNFAKRKYGLCCVQADINFLPFKNKSFNAIISNGVVVYLNHTDFDKLVRNCSQLLKTEGYLMFNEPLEYVRWFKTYLRLFHLSILEKCISRVYWKIAKIRGLKKGNSHNLDNISHPDLFIKKEKNYRQVLMKNKFTQIFVRPTFVNLAPPSIENYFLNLTFFLAPHLYFVRKNICSYLYIISKKSYKN